MEREVDQINVIPLVDIMLVLLVIVLTTATFITTGQIPVNLAKASASSGTSNPFTPRFTVPGGPLSVARRTRRSHACPTARP